MRIEVNQRDYLDPYYQNAIFCNISGMVLRTELKLCPQMRLALSRGNVKEARVIEGIEICG